jgi:DNA ligase (NAD+)
MRDIIDYLNRCTVAYDKGEPIISDQAWDKIYFDLLDMEHKTGTVYPDSPTQKVYYETVSSLNKVTHNHKMLSLEKTKDIDEIRSFVGKKDFLAMCKMDGLTCSLTYRNGKLVAAETRGNGIVGEDILHNAMVIPSIPKRIRYQDELVVDGEIICTYDDFEMFASDYKNPRNFAAGSIRLLDAKECEKRHLTYVAWDVLTGYPDSDTLMDKLIQLTFEHFTVVPWEKGDVEDCIKSLTDTAASLGYPIDGCVFKFNDIAYGQSLGETSHHFKNAMAYKFFDETYSSYLRDIEWTMGRTGILTPVAIFDPIDMDGSTVERASLHNISVMEETLACLDLEGFEKLPIKGQRVEVYKANMIIPQIAFVSTDELDLTKAESIPVPSVCPVCGGITERRTDNNSTVLYCTNLACEGKLINRLDHFCGKKGLDIKGLSKATLEKLINLGWVSNYVDLFNLGLYETEWVQLAGFGEKSVANILNAIEASRHCDLAQFIAALGIPLIGTSASKDLIKHFSSWNDFITAIETGYHFYDINGFGYEMHSSLTSFNYDEAKILANDYLLFNSIAEEENTTASLDGLTFVITGKVARFKNRDEIKALIEKMGGKVASSVSKNTDYLINNDVTSTSSKNKTAQSLNIPIISEATFIETFGII